MNGWNAWMAGNGWKWLEMAKNGCNSRNVWKSTEMSENGYKWMEMARQGRTDITWLGMAINGCKWM